MQLWYTIYNKKKGGFMKTFAILLIRGYQRFISPSLGNNCRFYPSCSEYTKEAIERFGVIRGSRLGLNRIGRCSPENPVVGYDPVPDIYPIKK